MYVQVVQVYITPTFLLKYPKNKGFPVSVQQAADEGKF